MSEQVAGVRLEPGGPLVFCHTPLDVLERGQRVTVAWGDTAREAVVAVTPQQIIAAPAFADAPRIAGVVPTAPDALATSTEVADVVLLAAEGGEVGPADLARALGLAALPLPAAPPERR